MKFDRDCSPFGANIRPGIGRRIDCESKHNPENPSSDHLRARLIEAGFYEVISALEVSEDEAIEGLLRAIARLGGDGPGRVCPQCGRIVEKLGCVRNRVKTCSEMCARDYTSIA